MARIILKCPYLKSGKKQHVENMIHYIAKREGVKKIDVSWRSLPATKEQEQFVERMLKEYPEAKKSFEYEDYVAHPSKGTATELIDHAIEEMMMLDEKRENYVGYIAQRPHVERHGSHGLFTDSNVPIQLSKVAKEVAAHDGNVWTYIISLRREDATRLGYDNAYAWRDLLRSQTGVIAENMKIPLSDLRWYAAFHDEGYHPHAHMVVYSTGKEPYLSKQGILQIKSSLAHQIFKQDLLQIYEKQTTQRNALTAQSREALASIATRINNGSYDNPVLDRLLLQLSRHMETHKGKKFYGYLTQPGRNLVNAIVDELAKDPDIATLYDSWYQQRNAILNIYSDDTPKRIPLSQNKEFKPIKNAVIREAVTIQQERISIQKELVAIQSESCTHTQQVSSAAPVMRKESDVESILQPSTLFSSLRLLSQLVGIFENNLRQDDGTQETIESKEHLQTIEKKQAHGLKMG